MQCSNCLSPCGSAQRPRHNQCRAWRSIAAWPHLSAPLPQAVFRRRTLPPPTSASTTLASLPRTPIPARARPAGCGARSPTTSGICRRQIAGSSPPRTGRGQRGGGAPTHYAARGVPQGGGLTTRAWPLPCRRACLGHVAICIARCPTVKTLPLPRRRACQGDVAKPMALALATSQSMPVDVANHWHGQVV